MESYSMYFFGVWLLSLSIILCVIYLRCGIYPYFFLFMDEFVYCPVEQHLRCFQAFSTLNKLL